MAKPPGKTSPKDLRGPVRALGLQGISAHAGSSFSDSLHPKIEFVPCKFLSLLHRSHAYNPLRKWCGSGLVHLFNCPGHSRSNPIVMERRSL